MSGTTTWQALPTLRVNKPLTFGQTKVYLTGHGYAPHFVLRDRSGRVRSAYASGDSRLR